MTEQQTDLRERELGYWMGRAYEAEQRAWQAEARIKAVEDVLDRWQVDGYDALLRRIRRALDGA